MRPSNRQLDELRPVAIERAVSLHAEGSCLVKFGNTHVLCIASLEERVDFPALRESLRAEISAQLLPGNGDGLPDNPFGALAVGLASKVLEEVVEATVTPAGLARIARGDSRTIPDDTRSPTPSDRDARHAGDLFENSRLERETLRRFSVWVPNDRGQESRFVFRRRGLSWILTAIELPDLAGAAD